MDTGMSILLADRDVQIGPFQAASMKAGPVVATQTSFCLAASTQRWNTFVTPTFVASGPEGIYQGKRMILIEAMGADLLHERSHRVREFRRIGPTPPELQGVHDYGVPSLS
jgi:hypothetical protein